MPAGNSVALSGDYDGDGKSDLLLTDSAGHRAVWFMDGTTVRKKTAVANQLPAWTIQQAGAE